MSQIADKLKAFFGSKRMDGFLIVIDKLFVDKEKRQDFLVDYFHKHNIVGYNCFDEYKRKFNPITFNILVDIVIIDGNLMHYIMRDGSAYTIENCYIIIKNGVIYTD